MSDDLASMFAELAAHHEGKSLDFGLSPGCMGVDANDGLDSALKPVVLGQELALINDPMAVCMGKLGGTKVCLAQAHQHQKVIIGFSRFLLVRAPGRGENAFCQPCLSAEDMTERRINEFVNEVEEKDWGSVFKVAVNGGLKSVEDEVRFKELMVTAKKVQKFVTPESQIIITYKLLSLCISIYLVSFGTLPTCTKMF